MADWFVPRAWAGETAFILGGGASLTGFDAGCLRGRGRVIAIKEAGLMMAPWADVLYWTDGWWHDGKEGFRGARDRLHLHAGRWKIARAAPVRPAVPDIRVLRPAERAPLSLDPGALAGACSGGAAINLAFLFGARRIVLLGFDMKGGNWDGRARMATVPQQRAQRHMPAIAAMAWPLAQAGVEVINASLDSALGCFRRAPLAELIGGAPPRREAEKMREIERLETVPAARLDRALGELARGGAARVRIRLRGADVVTRRTPTWWQQKLSSVFAWVRVVAADAEAVTFRCEPQ